MAKIRKKPKKSINKNINKKQSTPNIAEKLDNEMVAFLDTEFLTSQIKGGPPRGRAADTWEENLTDRDGRTYNAFGSDVPSGRVET